MIQAKNRNRLPLPQPATVHIRRSYAESRFGQIHVWTAYPSGGGFDERTPLLCLHHAGGSGRFFAPMLRELGTDRSVYAVDLPGHGTSDAPSAKSSLADLTSAVGDFLDSLRLRTVDVFGYQLGAVVSAELAIARAQQVRRLMLWGVPGYAAQDRVAVLAQPMREDGSDVIEDWRRALENRGPGTSVAAVADDFSDRLRAGSVGARAAAAVADYPASERLPLVRQQSLVMRLKDEFWDHAPRARASLSNSSMLDLSEYGQGFISAAPQRFAAVAREFLDR
ncbi:pimeloyl-ACP methyl ester carboxylesterase [Povalibacter uvarum]|uniref:Pimeloyl-ACP methyl ester carboxylesterase n=1 Tax=Povalibacter uvarum TaxID=732238 RepID=A0A841HWI8_9GAMM|nr:alpha/beta hydrolase [Povalibacter uvarum]MBB6096570.1 pimeloyl-ACP methyl ester carboxylesterase [Povalibacter uvarum]